jgi:hypothetical protein
MLRRVMHRKLCLLLCLALGLPALGQKDKLPSFWSLEGISDRVDRCWLRLAKGPADPLILKLQLKKLDEASGKVLSAGEASTLEDLKKSTYIAFRLWEYILRQNQLAYEWWGRGAIAKKMDVALRLLAEMNPNLASATVVSMFQEMRPWSAFLHGDGIRYTEHRTIEDGPDEHLRPYLQAVLKSSYLERHLQDPNYLGTLGDFVSKTLYMDPSKQEPALLAALGQTTTLYLQRLMQSLERQESLSRIEVGARFAAEMGDFFRQMLSNTAKQPSRFQKEWRTIATQQAQDMAALAEALALVYQQRLGSELNIRPRPLRQPDILWPIADVSEISDELPIKARENWKTLVRDLRPEFREYRRDAANPRDRSWKFHQPFSKGLWELEVSKTADSFFTLNVHLHDARDATEVNGVIREYLGELGKSSNVQLQINHDLAPAYNSMGAPYTLQVTFRSSGLPQEGPEFIEFLYRTLLRFGFR